LITFLATVAFIIAVAIAACAVTGPWWIIVIGVCCRWRCHSRCLIFGTLLLLTKILSRTNSIAVHHLTKYHFNWHMQDVSFSWLHTEIKVNLKNNNHDGCNDSWVVSIEYQMRLSFFHIQLNISSELKLLMLQRSSSWIILQQWSFIHFLKIQLCSMGKNVSWEV
jgi:hypothetical protein